MTDRELLELAAKAAGLEINDQYGERYYPAHCKPDAETPSLLVWNVGVWDPLMEDGDALRLAVKLRLVVHVWDDETHVSAAKTLSDGEDPESTSDAWEGCAVGADGDVAAATRRAIVRAAAEIGRNKA